MKILLSLALLVVALPVTGEELAGPSSNAVQLAWFYHQGHTNDVLRLYRNVAQTPEQNDPDVMFEE